ncbi:hypothetical protein E2562_026838 [Oryza meyeriana var. granulata]|uniref:Uncharacterized protein n=1 Tax=Oryza meyeriana var. granulata TaxID=110450 RepID=A0A6G1CJ61_9ORYZ|nr:hypothetical protein E2562_026838 [Oryza meyeriana var. granulata]
MVTQEMGMVSRVTSRQARRLKVLTRRLGHVGEATTVMWQHSAAGSGVVRCGIRMRVRGHW